MKNLKHLVIVAGMTLLTGALSAAEVKVIANSSVTLSDISTDELKRIFLATKTSLDDGTRVEPVLGKSGAAHESFLKEYVGKTDAALSTYYRSLVFTGKASLPKSFASDAEVISYVAKTKGAVGYVSAAAAVTGVKTLEVK